MKRNHLPLKEFINQLKSTLKGKYNAAVWPIAGITLLYLALTALLALLFTRSAMMLGYATMLIMYGMISQVLLAVVEALGILILWFLVTFVMYFVNMSILYSYQDQIKNPNLKVSATTIWKHFKHLNKNQLLRLTLYSSLFICTISNNLDLCTANDSQGQNAQQALCIHTTFFLFDPDRGTEFVRLLNKECSRSCVQTNLILYHYIFTVHKQTLPSYLYIENLLSQPHCRFRLRVPFTVLIIADFPRSVNAQFAKKGAFPKKFYALSQTLLHNPAHFVYNHNIKNC